jgi:glycosyltransferase involved in cell wall biosynthesis
MSKSPVVSVCVPSYNYGRFLPDCIESVQQQTFTDWEMIICDDQSTDGTESVVASYAARDPRIRYIRNGQRRGMNPNLKFAAEQGQGKYLKILCADDWLAPRCLEIMVNLMEAHPNVVLGTSAEIHTDAEGKPQFVQFLFGQPLSVIPGKRMLNRMAAGKGFGGNSSFIIRASAYHHVGGYRASVRYCGDFELAARLCRVGDYLHTDEPLFYGRSHSASSSLNDPGKLLDVMDFLELPGELCTPRPFLSLEWMRYQRFSGHMTARYLTYALIECLRGRRAYVSQLWPIVRRHGNFPAGLATLPFHLVYRVYAWVAGLNIPRRLPASPTMGSPSLLRGESTLMDSV